MATQLISAPGPDGALPLLETCGPREIFARIRPTVGPTAGRFDTSGHPLHLRYRITRGKDIGELRPRTVSGPTTAQQPLEIRLGGNQRHVLRHFGALDLVGGVGNWEVEIWEGRANLEPHWHRMPALLAGGSTYTLPFYERIASVDAALLVTDAMGLTFTLTQQPVSAVTPTLTGPPLGSHLIWTEWFG